MTAKKKPVTINSRLRGACIQEAKANLSGAAAALREDSTSVAREMMARSCEALDRADAYELEDAPAGSGGE
jgi:hypothetical protein